METFWDQCRTLLRLPPLRQEALTLTELQVHYPLHSQALEALEAELLVSDHLSVMDVPRILVALNHGYEATGQEQSTMLQLLSSISVKTETLASYYRYCDEMRRDVIVENDHELEYWDFFTDSRVRKAFVSLQVQGRPLEMTMVCIADYFRFHAALLFPPCSTEDFEAEAQEQWAYAQMSKIAFIEKLRQQNLSEDERLHLWPCDSLRNGDLYLNYVAAFLFVRSCSGSLAIVLRLKEDAVQLIQDTGRSESVRLCFQDVQKQTTAKLTEGCVQIERDVLTLHQLVHRDTDWGTVQNLLMARIVGLTRKILLKEGLPADMVSDLVAEGSAFMSALLRIMFPDAHWLFSKEIFPPDDLLLVVEKSVSEALEMALNEQQTTLV